MIPFSKVSALLSFNYLLLWITTEYKIFLESKISHACILTIRLFHCQLAFIILHVSKLRRLSSYQIINIEIPLPKSPKGMLRWWRLLVISLCLWFFFEQNNTKISVYSKGLQFRNTKPKQRTRAIILHPIQIQDYRQVFFFVIFVSTRESRIQNSVK